MNRKGITLIELLVALGVSGILLAGVYRTFVSQQHTFTVQEQVVDMQQNVRLAINRMTRELRMAGFGRMDAAFFGGGGMYGTFNNIVNPGGGGTSVTVVEGYQTLIPTTLSTNATAGSNSIFVNDVSSFDTATKKYISINGLESHQISTIIGNEIKFPGTDKLTKDHLQGERLYLVMAITYSRVQDFEGKWCLMRDDHLGAGPQPVAENIENLQFAYFDASGNLTANPPDIRMIQVNIVAISDKTDPNLAKVGDGFRRRTLTSNIQLRNLSF
jgi:prepilin-type N-terminal cleavage/methylation domain-containing protein